MSQEKNAGTPKFNTPSPVNPHYEFWEHIKAGGRVWRSDPANDVQEWIDLNTLDGDANAIQRYGYKNLSLTGPWRPEDQYLAVKVKTFLVWCLDHESTRDDAKRIKAAHHADAASLWAEWEDAHSADYWIVGGQTATVMVAEDVAGSEAIKYTVTGQSVPVYSPKQA